MHTSAPWPAVARVEDPSGNLLRKEEFDLSPLVGFNVTARF